MRWAVIGNQGMFGRELAVFLESMNEEVFGFNRRNLNFGDEPNEIDKQIHGFDVWVNCVAYTAVDKAENELLEANKVNGIFAGTLAKAAAIQGARFIHISTDYVFDGDSFTPYKTTDEVHPHTAYGKSKALGELLVSESGADYSTLRTAWLYGEFGNCFPKAIARKLLADSSARVVADQFGQPTWTRDLAEQVFQVAQLEEMPRIVHATASGKTNWAKFATEIAMSLGIDSSTIEEISSSELNTAATRPTCSVLDNSSKLISPIGDWRDRWRKAAPSVLREFLI